LIKLKSISGIMCLTAITVVTLFSVQAYAVVKISPNKAYPGTPITIIDTPNGRLTQGSVAVFIMDDEEMIIPLRNHDPGKTAQGELPDDIFPGVYQVIIRKMDNTEFSIGEFEVLQKPSKPYITPSEGPAGTTFTIVDPLGRMSQEDIVIFYTQSTDPINGVPAVNIVVSPDGTILTGKVSMNVEPGKNYVSVRPNLYGDSLFKDLIFRVTYSF
jgi:hypothetical protein